VAILLMVMTGIAGIAAHRSTAQEQEGRETRDCGACCCCLAAAAILMTRLSSAFWEHLPGAAIRTVPGDGCDPALPYGYFLAAATAPGAYGGSGACWCLPLL